MEPQRDMSLPLQIVKGDMLHPRIRRVTICSFPVAIRHTDPERLLNDLFWRIPEALLLKPHALAELTEKPHVRSSFTRRFDRLLRQLHKVVAVCPLDLGVFQESSRR